MKKLKLINKVSDKIIYGPNWRIIPPFQEQLDRANEKARYHIKYQKECIYCKSKFYYGKSNQNSCGLCYIHVDDCLYCGKSFCVLLNYNYSGISGTAFKYLRECIENNKEYNRFCCQTCLSRSNSDKWRESEEFQEFIRSDKFHTEKARKLSSERLKKYTKSPEGRKHIEKHSKDITPKLKYCDVCKTFTMHWSSKCSVCHPEVTGCVKPNFITKDGVRFFKGKPVEELVYNLLNDIEDINDYPELEIRFEHVCYNRKDILTDESILYSGKNITVRDNVEFILDHSTGRYVEAERFYSKYYERMNNIDGNEEINNFIKNEGFSKEPIVKINESMWNRMETDNLLVKNGYGWITYIKLLDNHPWIVGKTGTRKVSKSPIDFNFIIGDKSNPNYSGPGREYARRYYPEREFSDFDFILVKKFETEEEAFEFEQYIASKYTLFES